MSIVNGRRWNVRSSDASVGVVRSGWDFDLSVDGSVNDLQAQIDALDAEVAANTADISAVQAQANATDAALAAAVASITANTAAIAALRTYTVDDVVSEFDFSAMGNVVLANGPRNFTDTLGRVLAGTIINVGAAATAALQAAVGLAMVANATNSAYNSATQTAFAVEFSLDAIYTLYGLDAQKDWIFEVYCSALQFTTANVAPNGFNLGIRGVGGTPSNSAARYRGIRRGNLAGAQATSSVSDNAAGSAYTTAPASTSNVFALVSKGGAVTSLAGVWGGSWSTTLQTMENNSLTATSTTNSGFKDRNNILAIAFPTGNTAADMAVTVQRLRIRAR